MNNFSGQSTKSLTLNQDFKDLGTYRHCALALFMFSGHQTARERCHTYSLGIQVPGRLVLDR